jgi:hypothetical protein
MAQMKNMTIRQIGINPMIAPMIYSQIPRLASLAAKLIAFMSFSLTVNLTGYLGSSFDMTTSLPCLFDYSPESR